MSVRKWLADNNVTQEQYNLAVNYLGGNASFRAVRKMLGMLREGRKGRLTPWRAQPRVK